MTRQITEIMAHAFWNGESKKLSNTEVKNFEMYLFGNKIAWYQNGILYFTLCGWNTLTTRERLNGLGVGISQKNYKPIWNNQEIDTEKVYEMAV
jgi:hypothetical protein